MFELEDGLWEKLLEHINNTARDRGQDSDTGAMLMMIKEFYRIVDDPSFGDTIDDHELKILEQQDSEAEVSAQARKKRIKELNDRKKQNPQGRVNREKERR